MNNTIKKYKLHLKELTLSTNRSELLEIDSENFHTELGQRDRLLSGTNKLNETTERLGNSHRIAMETETIGVNILNDLRGQREQILHTYNTLEDADNQLDGATRTIRYMTRRMVANKAISYAILGVLVALILLIVYSKL